jgi:ABC-type branched-subunit amino acid transport system substrate-binding protein
MITRRHVLATGAAACVAGVPTFAIGASRPVVGLSLPIKGVQATVAKEMLSGYTAALEGVAEMRVLDDESVAAKTTKNIDSFAADSAVIATTGIVGTPHAKEAIPVARAGNLPVVGIRSGAGELRDGSQNVFHLRASYEEEINKVMEMASLYRVIGVLYSDDAFGKGALAHAEKVAAAKGCVIGAQIAVDRNGSNVKQKVAELALRKDRLGAVLLALIQVPALNATKELREGHNFVMPIFGMSFIATSTFAASTDPAYDGIALASPFPLARTAIEEMAASFRSKMAEAKTENLIASPTAFEAYFYASVLADAIVRGGPTRAKVREYLSRPAQMSVKQVPIKFDQLRVGYRYLNILRKAGPILRA